MSKGQITIPKDIRKILGISCGDRVTFVVENGTVKLITSAVYAMQMLQAQMNTIHIQPSGYYLAFNLQIPCVMVPIGQKEHQVLGLYSTITIRPISVDVSIRL